MTPWQRQNLAAIQQRLQPIRQLQDGLIYQKLTANHIVVVQKTGNKIRLALPAPGVDIVQSVLDLKDPLRLAAPYNQTFMLGLLWRPQPQRVFVAGLGGGCFPLVFHHHVPSAHITCADLDNYVILVAQQFFGLQVDERLTVVQQDARDCLASQKEPHDLIYLDVFMGNGATPYRLATQEFYQLCRQKLHPAGIVAINMAHDDPFHADKIATFQAVFDNTLIFRVEMGNSVVIGTDAPLPNAEQFIEQTRSLQNQHRFAFSLLKRGQQLYRSDRFHELIPSLLNARILRDETPPPDYPSLSFLPFKQAIPA